MVKRTVNQDDVRAYHLFYADAAGSPGTDVTFFEWDLPRERRGTRSIVGTGLRVESGESLEWWRERLTERGVAPGEVEHRGGRHVLDFEDPEGQRLFLVEDGGAGPDPVFWEDGPVPEEHQIRGLGPVLLSVPDATDTDLLLTRAMGMERTREYSLSEGGPAQVHVYEMGVGGGAHAELHVAVQPELPVARQGAGGVHHVAFRVPDDGTHRRWEEHLRSVGVPNTGQIDRHYFRSLYFREPNGILFEIATDGPGFAVDEVPESLGESLSLPPFLEDRRAAIEANLKPLD